MPELPEVETVRRALDARLRGRVVCGVAVGRPTFYRRPPAVALKALEGGRVAGWRRRGKYLLLDLEGRGSVVFHLGMSGRLTIGKDGPHARLSFRAGDDEIFFHDARRFGRVGGPLPALGPEPLDPGFDASVLRAVLRGRSAPVKALLMDQRLIAGLGNIYASEALHLAGVRPARAGGSLTRAETASLAAACRRVLELGVSLGGSTLDDESFLDPLGRPGRMQERVKVYGRRACGTCGGPVRDTRRPIGGRSSPHCPRCQS